MLTPGLRTLEPTVYPAPVIHGRYHLLTNRKIQGTSSRRGPAGALLLNGEVASRGNLLS
jgi:hypothetical protein